MAKLPVPTAKEINDAHLCAIEGAGIAIEHAMRCGKLLTAKKQSLKESKGHGSWEAWVEQWCKFGIRQAQRYMQASTKSVSRDAFDSIRQALGYDKPKDKPAAKEPLTGAKVEAGAGAEPVPAKPVATPEPAATKPEPAAVAATSEPEWTDEDEAAANAVAEADYIERTTEALAADDKLAEAFEQIKKQSILIAAANRARDHAMQQAAEAVRLLKARDREIARLQKQIKRQAA